jgi:crossover junction endodeoxyribonuclease RuvC
MPGILGLDLATVTGWALARPGHRHLSGVHRIAPPNTAIGYFLLAFEEWLIGQIEVLQPNAVVFEAPILTGGETSIETARKLMCLAGFTEATAIRKKIPIVKEVNNQQLKVFWAGTGRASKEQMVEAARARGYDVSNHNEADALAIVDFAIVKLAPKSPEARAHYLGAGLPLLHKATEPRP